MSGPLTMPPQIMSMPNPDPTVATMAMLERIVRQRDELVDAQLEVKAAELHGFMMKVEQRLDDMDKANDILAGNVNRVPTDLQVALSSVKELNAAGAETAAVKFDGITDKFNLLDKQTARESAANTLAVNAAFAAQKESAAATDKANAEAIRKSEAATAETINKLEQLVAGQITSLNDKVEDGKTSVTVTRQELIAADASFRQEMTAALNGLRTELVQVTTRTAQIRDSKVDHREDVGQNRASINMLIGIVGAIVAVAVLALTVYTALKP